MPNAKFYVPNHFGIPNLDPDSWRLHLSGLVERRLSLGLAQLRAMPSASVVVTLECAGNGRAGLKPPAPGEQWDIGAVSTAEWTGVPLTEVLDRAGIRATAQEALFRGADRGQVDEHGERVHFERSLPVDRLGQAGALLAYVMNGEELPAQRGYPLRLVVPGWYAVASVKWLTEIELIAQPFRGHFQADRYHIDGKPLSVQRVRSLIIEPAPGATAAPRDITIRAVAWSGAAPVARVEVSIGNAPWRPATLIGEPVGTAGSGGSCQPDSPAMATSRSGPGPPTWLGGHSRTSRYGIRSATPTTPSTKSIWLPQRPPAMNGDRTPRRSHRDGAN